MASYWIKTPECLPRFFPKGMIWRLPASAGKTVYITFDDGPHPAITPWVLRQLANYDAAGTFFCVGNNVARYPDVFASIQAAGHQTGNHTYNHLNGWKTNTNHYLRNVAQATRQIGGNLFRPPYGRLRMSQYRRLLQGNPDTLVYMWDVLSGDFDTGITPEQCINNVISHIEPGSIVVFHDSEKAWPRLEQTLPAVLDYCRAQGWAMKPLPTRG